MKKLHLRKIIILLNFLYCAKTFADNFSADESLEETFGEEGALAALNDTLSHETEETENPRSIKERMNQLEEIIESLIYDDMAFLEKKVRKIIKKVVDDKKAEIDQLVKAKLNLLNNHNKVPLNIQNFKCPNNNFPTSCHHLNECSNNIYNIQIPEFSSRPFPAVCDFKTENGGWTVIQRRQDGSENFFRNWTEYVEGFGNMNGEFFIGLKKLHALTTLGEPQELYIIFEDFEGERRYARYRVFKIDSDETDYMLNVGNYSGNVGDCFSSHSGKKFSTKDRDNDEKDDDNCAAKFKGAWWYSNCFRSNLNGLYLAGKVSTSKQGVSWCSFRGYEYSLKFVQMMIRPRAD